MGREVFRFNWPAGRGYSVEGVFTSTQAQVDALEGSYVNFGEICGKHSQMSGIIEPGEIIAISKDPAVVEFVDECGGFGHDPVAQYIQDKEKEMHDYAGAEDPEKRAALEAFMRLNPI